MIAIHYSEKSFANRWINYCEKRGINYKRVNCHKRDILNQLKDCDALMWHFSHMSSRDFLFAKQLVFALEKAGKVVFPDSNTSWHFDDKVGQYYLLASIDAPIIPTYIFYSKEEACQWVKHADFPKVFKLRAGAGSVNVRLVRTAKEALAITKRAFGRGFKHSSLIPFNDMLKKYRQRKVSFKALFKSLLRKFIPTQFALVHGRERGYVYFQDFISECDCDFRIKVVDGKCWGFRRFVRDNDFRASGSGKLDFDPDKIPLSIVKSALDIARKLNLQSVAFDYLMHKDRIYVIEMSYGFGVDPGETDYGYWDSTLKWHKGKFDPFGWMVDLVLKKVLDSKADL